ncbi:MAG: polysaccharide deacetylase family protein [Candidatus Aminicenantia bacterium]
MKKIIIIFILIILFLSFSFADPVRYRVLLVEGNGSYEEYQNSFFVEKMLISWNIPFDKIKVNQRITSDLLKKGITLLYSTVILSRAGANLNFEEVNLLKNLSKDYGMSIISFFNFPDDRVAPIFGIQEFFGLKLSDRFYFTNADTFITKGFGGERLYGGLYFGIVPLSSIKKYVYSDEDPVFFSYKYNNAVNYFFAFHPSDWDIYDGRHILLRRAIIQNSGYGFLYFDLEGTLLMRFDDPLGPVVALSDPSGLQYFPSSKKMDRSDWRQTVDVLKRHNAGMSLLVVTGFPDDANSSRGKIFRNGVEITNRACGAVLDTKDLRYQFVSGTRAGKIMDFEEEYMALKEAMEYEGIDIHQHGWTHYDLHRWVWCESASKNIADLWVREFYHFYNRTDASYSEQWNAIENGYKKIMEWFGVEPAFFAFPANAYSKNTFDVLKNFGYRMANGIDKDFFILKDDKFINPYFIETTSAKLLQWNPKTLNKWIPRSFPFIVYTHDYELLYFGIDWLDSWFEDFEKMGVRNFITFGELLGYLFSDLEAIVRPELYGMTFTIDISETGGPNNLPSSRFFSTRKMKLLYKVPERWIGKEELKGKEIVEIKIEPFKEKTFYAGRFNISDKESIKVLKDKPFGKH